MRSRVAGIDALRIVGIIGVVAGHVWWQSDLVRSLIYTWHVPLFFFLTGYFWKRKRGIAEEVAARWRSLLIPYLSWLVLISIVFVPWLLMTGRDDGPRAVLNILIGGAHAGRPYSAFWFITALFFATVLLRLVQRSPLWVPAVISAGAVLVTYVVPHPIAAFPLSAGTAVPAIAFILCGYGARNIEPAVKKPLVVAAVLLLGAAATIVLGSRSLDLKQADFGSPIIGVAVAAAIAWGLLLVSTALGDRWPEAVGSRISELARCGTGVILTHAAVLEILNTPDGGRWSDFLIALVVPWAAMVLVARTPLAPVLLGSAQRRSAGSVAVRS